MQRFIRRATSTVTAAALAAACVPADRTGLGPVVTVAESGASNPTVAVDPRGGVYYVAWVGATGNRSNVFVSRSLDGTAFETPVRANDIVGDAAPHEQAPAQIDVGPQGNVYLVWQNNTVIEGRRFPYSNLRFARSTDGGVTFEPATTVNDDRDGPPASHTFHDLIASPDGSVFVSWIDSRVRTALEDETPPAEGSGASTPGHTGAVSSQQGAGATGMAGHEGMAMDHGDGLPGPDIRVARSIDGGKTFEPSVVVAADACPCCRTNMAIGPDGALYIAWRTVLEGNVRDVVVARSDDGGSTFTPATRVKDDDWVFDACPHAGPALAVDAQGTVHIAWYTGAPPSPGIYSATSTDHGASFGNVQSVLTGEWVPPSQVKLASAGGRGVIAAWDDRRAQPPTLHISTTDRTSFADGAGQGMTGASPAVASAAGMTAVAWLDGDAVRVRTNRGGVAQAASR